MLFSLLYGIQVAIYIKSLKQSISFTIYETHENMFTIKHIKKQEKMRPIANRTKNIQSYNRINTVYNLQNSYSKINRTATATNYCFQYKNFLIFIEVSN